MKKIMVLLFLAGFLAGIFSILTALEWMQSLPWSVQTSELPTVQSNLRPYSPSFIQIARPTLRLQVSRIILRACPVPMNQASTIPAVPLRAPQEKTPTDTTETNATLAVKLRALAKLPDQTPATTTSTGKQPDLSTPVPVAQKPTQASPTKAVVTQPKARTQTKAKPKSQTLPGPDQLYARALKLYHSGQFSRSRTDFEAFGRAYPKHRLMPNALYWTGETWYAQQHFTLAQEKFIQVSSRYPRHDKSPDALLKQAYCVLRLGNTALAQQLLHSLQARYPKSEASVLGQRVLRSLQDHSAASLLGAAHG